MTFAKRTPEQRNWERLRRKEARAKILRNQADYVRQVSFTYVVFSDGDSNAAEIRFASSSGVKLNQAHCDIKDLNRSNDLRALRSIPTTYFNITARRSLLRELRSLALCDGPLCAAEKAALESIAEALKINRVQSKTARGTASSHGAAQRRNVRKEASHTSKGAPTRSALQIPWCYEFLGCTPTDTDQKIKSAYRRLAVRYHPDKHAALINEPEKIRHHVEAFQKLQTAYEEVQRLRSRNSR
jgi:DnaJ-domain-containing protein 1